MGSGGAQRQVMTLAKALKADDFDVAIAWYYNSEFYLDEITQSGIDHYRLYESNYFERLKSFRKLFKSIRPEWVVAYLPGPSVLGCLLKPLGGYNLIVNERSAKPSAQKSIKSRLYRLAYLMANYVCTNSFANMDFISESVPFLPSNKKKVIYNSLDLDYWADKTEVHGQDIFHMIVLSSHRRLKNLKGLIEAVNILNESFRQNLKISWYGDDSGDQSMQEGQKLIEAYGLEEVFYFQPAVTDVKSVIASATVIGLFSEYEGLPNAVCEGMAMSKPIIATKVSDLPRILDDQKELLCDYHDASTISKAIKSAMEMPKDQLLSIGTKNRKRATELFSTISNYNDLKSLLLQV